MSFGRLDHFVPEPAFPAFQVKVHSTPGRRSRGWTAPTARRETARNSPKTADRAHDSRCCTNWAPLEKALALLADVAGAGLPRVGIGPGT